jgi:ADP-ribose 1''-phosphate phosphatase
MISEKQGNLFDAPKGSLIVHACNTHGAWGAGIASDFARLYPEYHKAYAQMCAKHGNNLLGTALILQGKRHKVGCLFTSTGYGHKALYQSDILKATFHSLVDLFAQIPDTEIVHMPKINSGLFRVPWDKTLAVVEEFKDKEIVIWTP